MLSRYLHLEEIYSDTRCKVYKATRPEQEVIVVKTYELDSWIDREIYTKEAQIQISLEHPHICRCFDYYMWEANNHCYLAIEMELMDRDLEKESERRIKENDPWSEGEVRKCLGQLVSAFAYAQTRKIAHRDIKPTNLFVHQGLYKVADFGSASHRPNDSTKEKLNQTIAGTPAFFSPELSGLQTAALRSKFENPRITYNAYKSDVYTLAVSLVVTSSAVSMNNLQNPEAVMKELDNRRFSQELKELFGRMLVIDPESRISFTELNRILNPGEASQEEEQTSSVDFSSETDSSLHSTDCVPPCLTPGFSGVHDSDQPGSSYDSFLNGLEGREQTPRIPFQFCWQGPIDSKATTLRFRCLVCNAVTPNRYFPCLKHSICSPKCLCCVKLVLVSVFSICNPDTCPVCSGMNYLEELRKITEQKLRRANCHFCDSSMDMKTCIYCVCGGRIELVCSKQCVQRKMASMQYRCSKCGSDIEVHRLMEARLFKSWQDLPVYSEVKDCCMCFNAIKIRFQCGKRHGLCAACQSKYAMYLCPVCTKQLNTDAESFAKLISDDC